MKLWDNFFQAALVGCFFKVRMLNKQERVLQSQTFQEILRPDVFHPGIKYLYGK